MNAWDQIKRRLGETSVRMPYRNWVVRTSLRSADGDSIVITTPDEATRWFMESEYADSVQGAIRDSELAHIGRSVYEIGEAAEMQPRPEPSGEHPCFPGRLTPDQLQIQFRQFRRGPVQPVCACRGESCGYHARRSYNPLFIYGGVGMGKTHLMHAIGKSLVENFAGMRIVYTTSERFMNQMINCIKLDRMPQFHQYFRSADVLLIDDIQIIGGKERTQEEFFYTFNELYEHQKQIVISSDTPPKNTPGSWNAFGRGSNGA